MRTLEEIQADVIAAIQSSDADRLQQLADELLSVDDPSATGRALNLAGWAAYLHGDYQTAISKGLEAASIFEAQGNKAAQSRAYGNVGLAYNQLGEAEDALRYVHLDLALKVEIHDPGVAPCYSNLGLIYNFDGQYVKAFEAMNKALDIATAGGDDYQVTLNIGNLGNVFRRTGNYPQALENYYRALEGYERLGNKAYAAVITGNIGGVFHDMQKPAEALEWHERAMVQYKEVGDRYGQSQIHKALASDLSDLGRYSEASHHLDLAEALAEEIGNKKNMMNCRLDRCHLLLAQNDIEGIREILPTIDMTDALPDSKCSYAIVASSVLRTDGDLDAIIELYTDTLAHASASNARREMMSMHGALRDIAKERMDFEGYVRHSEAFQALREELHGSQAMDKVAVLDKERAIAKERSLRDKERSILYSTLPPPIADRIIAGEDVSGDHHEQAVVLFLDVVGFTTHSSEMTPQETTALLARMFNSFDAICAEHGVTKVKTIGDSYLCFAGSDIGERISDIGPEERIAAVALAMQQAEFYWPSANSQQQQPTVTANSNRVQFRIGLHSGPVVAGVIGTERLQYDVWGDTVNVASRMESTGEPGRIQVSSAFADLLLLQRSVAEEDGSANSNSQPQQKLTERGAIDIKGKGTMTTYWLKGA